jgi:hypothetical protein
VGAVRLEPFGVPILGGVEANHLDVLAGSDVDRHGVDQFVIGECALRDDQGGSNRDHFFANIVSLQGECCIYRFIRLASDCTGVRK